MNIMCSINDAVIRQFKSLIFSLAESQNDRIDLFFVNSSLNDAQIDNIRKYVEALDINFHLIIPPKEIMERMSSLRGEALHFHNNFFSLEAFVRLFAPTLLPNEISRILWIDSDCIVQRDIRKMYNFNFAGKLGFVTIDGYELDSTQKDYVIENIKKPLGLKDDDVLFNSGVFLMNLDAMRKDTRFSTENIFKEIETHPEIKFDQDILNYLCKGDIYINKNQDYNFPPNWSYYKELEEGLTKKYILHYYGIHKPWLDSSSTPSIGVGPYKRAEKMSYIIDNLIGSNFS